MRFQRSLLGLILCLMLALAVPERSTDALRSGLLGTFRPVWQILGSVLQWPFVKKSTVYALRERSDKLALENAQLREELLSRDLPEPSLQALAGRVIYRGIASYGSSLWIDVGAKDGVAKNSPVLVGDSLIGVIEYVGRSSSRVLLISDASLTPSVRAARGGEQDRRLCQHIEAVQAALVERDDLLESQEARSIMGENLEILRGKLRPEARTQFLAKGVLQGAEGPLWRGRSTRLKGTGFNYDHADAEGPARDLRTGQPYGETREPVAQILQVGDLLITTGMDGVFPPGLHVARVTDIDMLQEGAYYYELRAQPTAGNLEAVRDVLVLPPLPDHAETI